MYSALGLQAPGRAAAPEPVSGWRAPPQGAKLRFVLLGSTRVPGAGVLAFARCAGSAEAWLGLPDKGRQEVSLAACNEGTPALAR